MSVPFSQRVIERPESTTHKLARGVHGAVSQGIPMVAQHLIGQRQRQASDEFIKNQFGIDSSRFTDQLREDIAKLGVQKIQQNEIVEELVNLGIPEKDARLYAKLTVGGQTKFIEQLLEQKTREGEFAPRQLEKTKRLRDVATHEEGQREIQESSQDRILSPEEQEESEIENVLRRQDTGLTPKERVARETKRFETGLPARQEAKEKLESAATNKRLIGVLEDLEKSNKLIKGFGTLTLDESGNVRAGFLTRLMSPESQRFIKTINEFSQNAKGTYGARVTNFDLQQFMRRYPSLLNTPEGRRQILEQMKLFNDINSIYYKNLQKVYDRAGGARKIDADMTSSIAEKMSEKKVEELSAKLGQIGSKITSLPSASEFKGKKIRNKETGEIMQSDGENWLPTQG